MKILVAITIISAYCLNGSKFYSTFAIMESHIDKEEKVTLIGHRGAAGLAPENTLAAIDSGIFYKAPYLEIDIRRTKDSVLVVMHDRAVNRTTNGKGKIEELNWNEIEKLDAGSHFSEKFKNEKVPRLTDVLERVKSSNSILVVEVKNPGRYPGIAKQLNDAIKKAGAENKTVIFSYDVGFIRSFRQLDAAAKLGCIYVFPPRETAPEIASIDFVGVYWLTGRLFSKRIKKIQGKGIKAWAWTIDSKKKINKLHNKGFDGIVTNYPDLNSPVQKN